MKKRTPRVVAALALIAAMSVLAVSCGRDALFWNVSMERPPVRPRVPGGPSQMAHVDDWGGSDVFFVASGSLFWYGRAHSAGGSNWNFNIGLSQPPGRIVDVAATTGFLYVLSMVGTGIEASIWRVQVGVGNPWVQVGGTGGFRTIDAIFADGGTLFAAARGDGAVYSILQLDDNGTITTVPASAPGMLTGAANGFLSTTSGIFDDNGDRLVEGNFQGILAMDSGSAIAVRIDGAAWHLYAVTTGAVTRMNADTSGRLATGALAAWDETLAPDGTILVGTRGGYLEFVLDAGATPPIATRRAPGSFESIRYGNYAQFNASLGRHPVNHLFRAPPGADANRTLFASTQVGGLWSFRSRPGGWEWNAEE